MTRRPRRYELDPIEHRRLHEEAILIARMYPETFPGVRKPSRCVFDAKPPAGTLATLRANTRSATVGDESNGPGSAQTPPVPATPATTEATVRDDTRRVEPAR